MMTNELLMREDFLSAVAWASGRQAGQHFRTQLANELKEVLQQSSQTTKQWLKSSEVSPAKRGTQAKDVLGISHGTLQNLGSIEVCLTPSLVVSCSTNINNANCSLHCFKYVKGGPTLAKPCSFLILSLSSSDILLATPSLSFLKYSSILPAG
jgi:hypothetical protein